jgi:tetratricopeptide (TPR) repeat protein
MKIEFKKIFLSLILSSSLFSPLLFAQKPDALALYRAGKYAESVAVCEQELLQNPKNVNSYVVLCWSLVGKKDYAKAEAKAIEGRNISSTDTRLIEILAEAKYYQGKNAGALEYFQLYIANAPPGSSDIGFAYLYMGEIYIRQAKYQHADMAFSAAVHEQPSKYAYWWTRCGYAREMVGNYETAKTAYEKALSLDPSSPDAARGKKRAEDALAKAGV